MHCWPWAVSNPGSCQRPLSALSMQPDRGKRQPASQTMGEGQIRALVTSGHVVGTQGWGSRAADMGTMVERALDSPNFPRETEAQRHKGHVQGQEARTGVPGFGTGLRNQQLAGQMQVMGECGADKPGWTLGGCRGGWSRQRWARLKDTHGGDRPQTGELSQTWWLR